MIGASIFFGLGCSDTGKTTPDTDKTTVQTGVDIGDTAPDFDLRNQDQIKISLSEFKGKKNVVLVFYPADFTPV
jgi:peroxiredoxin